MLPTKKSGMANTENYIKCLNRTNLIQYLEKEGFTAEVEILKPRDIDGQRFLELSELDLVRWRLSAKQKKLILDCRDKILNCRDTTLAQSSLQTAKKPPVLKRPPSLKPPRTNVNAQIVQKLEGTLQFSNSPSGPTNSMRSQGTFRSNPNTTATKLNHTEDTQDTNNEYVDMSHKPVPKNKPFVNQSETKPLNHKKQSTPAGKQFSVLNSSQTCNSNREKPSLNSDQTDQSRPMKIHNDYSKLGPDHATSPKKSPRPLPKLPPTLPEKPNEINDIRVNLISKVSGENSSKSFNTMSDPYKTSQDKSGIFVNENNTPNEISQYQNSMSIDEDMDYLTPEVFNKITHNHLRSSPDLSAQPHNTDATFTDRNVRHLPVPPAIEDASAHPENIFRVPSAEESIYEAEPVSQPHFVSSYISPRTNTFGAGSKNSGFRGPASSFRPLPIPPVVEKDTAHPENSFPSSSTIESPDPIYEAEPLGPLSFRRTNAPPRKASSSVEPKGTQHFEPGPKVRDFKDANPSFCQPFPPRLVEESIYEVDPVSPEIGPAVPCSRDDNFLNSYPVKFESPVPVPNETFKPEPQTERENHSWKNRKPLPPPNQNSRSAVQPTEKKGKIWNVPDESGLPKPPTFQNKVDQFQVSLAETLRDYAEFETGHSPSCQEEFNPNNCLFYRNTDRKGAKQLLSGIPNLIDGTFLFRNSDEYFLAITAYHNKHFYNIGLQRNEEGKIYCKTDNELIESFNTLDDFVKHYKSHPLTLKAKGSNPKTIHIFLKELFPKNIF